MGLFATSIGTLLGLAGSYYFQEVGLDTRIFAGEMSLGGVAFDPVWRAVISLKTLVIPIVAMWITCLVASIYPAAIAARLDPVRAIQHV